VKPATALPFRIRESTSLAHIIFVMSAYYNTTREDAPMQNLQAIVGVSSRIMGIVCTIERLPRLSSREPPPSYRAGASTNFPFQHDHCINQFVITGGVIASRRSVSPPSSTSTQVCSGSHETCVHQQTLQLLPQKFQPPNFCHKSCKTLAHCSVSHPAPLSHHFPHRPPSSFSFLNVSSY
jgi:hypothetical protein